MLTGLSGTMCLPTGRPMPERSRREEVTERPTTPFPPMIFDATLLNRPAILSIFFFAVSAAICFVVFAGFLSQQKYNTNATLAIERRRSMGQGGPDPEISVVS